MAVETIDVEKVEIIQEEVKGKALSATLVKERELRIENALNRKTIKYSIDVVALKDESQKKVLLGWKWFVAGLVVILVSFLIPTLLSSFFPESLISYLVYLLGVLAGAGCFYMAWKATSVKHIFYSRNANVPLVELFTGKPSKKEFSDFVNKVEQSVRAIQDKMNLSMKNQLAGEMRMLRRLSEEGVVSPIDYKKAQADLLSKH